MLDNTSFLDARIVQKEYREEALARLEDLLQNEEEKHGAWWKHGVVQVIKFLENDFYDNENSDRLRKRFREFCDTLDRNRKNSCWYETFEEDLASKVLNDR